MRRGGGRGSDATKNAVEKLFCLAMCRLSKKIAYLCTLALCRCWITFINKVLTKRKEVDSLSYKTISANASTVTKEWVVIDATNEVLGRLASQVAKILRGKNKPCYTPHADCGDYVIVINADKVKLTGKKMTDKVYVRYTGHPGGQRFATPADYLQRKPEFLVEKAVKGMLPRTRLGAAILKNLKVYAGAEHPHVAQNPKEIKLSEIK